MNNFQQSLFPNNSFIVRCTVTEKTIQQYLHKRIPANYSIEMSKQQLHFEVKINTFDQQQRQTRITKSRERKDGAQLNNKRRRQQFANLQINLAFQTQKR
ncbi:hypothetical protein A4A49_27766 [Nicotiana attenuata]|uniref:Uncharacterized protein n=1 Tax=Nicotiana attenuata TaxID=49451 RepID=A0A1J6IG71_NICAT|nr:hypothetical protein A4A49_27766 [Nicotiana attenuata]